MLSVFAFVLYTEKFLLVSSASLLKINKIASLCFPNKFDYLMKLLGFIMNIKTWDYQDMISW